MSSIGDPAFNCFEVRNGCPVERDMRVGAVVSVGARFALEGKVETKVFAAWELRTMVDVVGGNNHAKGGIPSRRVG